MEPFGALLWNDREAYYRQDDNPAEHLLKVRSPGRGWLETCGPTAAVNCVVGVGAPVACLTPGGYHPQPEQVLCDCLNDPHHFADLRREWNGLDPEKVAGNEVAQWYPWAVTKVFGTVDCEFVGRMGPDEAADRLSRGQALQICLINPGHFVAVVAFSPEENAFIMNDPWAGRWPGGSGWNKRLSLKEFLNNTKPLTVAYA
jgi:hypothetical protein